MGKRSVNRIKVFSTVTCKFVGTVAFFAVMVVMLFGCEEDNFSSSSSIKLKFSADTVLFDTVFTTIGSSTRYLKVYNPSKYDVKISSIRLAGGSSSPYRINADGASGVSISDVNLRSKDSLFVFVEVTIDPARQNAPLLVEDSILFSTNGNEQNVKLVSWGQDVFLMNSRTIMSDTVFTTDKPYLVYNYLYVDKNCTLSIPAGVKIYFHNNAQLIVSGSLDIRGEMDNPVVFEGDRLENYYSDKAGQWSGVWLAAGSKYNSLSWTEIKNSVIGLIVDTCVTADAPTLVLSHSRVENCSYAGLLARGAKINADNCLFSNAAEACVALTLGGEYNFYHCTVANYWGNYLYRSGPALLLNNYYTYQLVDDGPTYLEPRDMVQANFFNTIIYGSLSSELGIDNAYNGQQVSAQMNYYFQDCIVRVPYDYDLTDEAHFVRVTRLDPKFRSIEEQCFELDTLSPAKDVAIIDISNMYPVDLNGFNRLTDGKPDLGAFERDE